MRNLLSNLKGTQIALRLHCKRFKTYEKWKQISINPRKPLYWNRLNNGAFSIHFMSRDFHRNHVLIYIESFIRAFLWNLFSNFNRFPEFGRKHRGEIAPIQQRWQITRNSQHVCFFETNNVVHQDSNSKLNQTEIDSCFLP